MDPFQDPDFSAETTDAPEAPPRNLPVRTVTEAKEATKTTVKDGLLLLRRYVLRHTPPPTPKPERPTAMPPLKGAIATWLPFLRVIPAALGALFALSFFWDFPGASVVVFGQTLAFEGLLRILSVSGLIGFLTNWLAISMLFHPREKRPIFGQGLIPAQRERVIFRLAKAVSEELINEEIIKQKIEESGVIPRYRQQFVALMHDVLHDPDFRNDVRGLTSAYVRQVLGSAEVRDKLMKVTLQKLEEHTPEGLGQIALRLYRTFNEEDLQRRIARAIDDLPTAVDAVLDETDHLLDRVPEYVDRYSDDIEDWATRRVLATVEQFDVYGMIVENMRQYDEHQLERLLKSTSNEQLNYIKYLGGILGMIGGLVIWKPLLALGTLGLIGLVLYTVDAALMKRPG